MKRPIKTFFALALLVLGNVPAFADSLASFNLTDFLGWTYTRPDFQLSTEAIGANKVRLFKASNATDYTLLSPVIEVDGIAAVTVKATVLAPTYSSKSYDLTKGSPTFELLDMGGNVVASEFLQYKSALVQRDVQVKIDIPSGVKTVKLRIAAWNADYNCPVAVRAVSVENGESGVTAVERDEAVIMPAAGAVTISNAVGLAVAVHDMQGRLCHKSTIATSSARISLAPGAYVVTVGNKTSKIIIN